MTAQSLSLSIIPTAVLLPSTILLYLYCITGGVGTRASMTSASLGGKLSGLAPQATPGGTGLVVFKLRGRLRNSEAQRSEGSAGAAAHQASER